ncbi:MAG TPA: hypothetical protein VGV07_02815 [Devosia sp.]|jgi:hypothetical protein|uniref:hypothetical protein n=1 Tax=Devosia sp. TaxID=1871048 RepID=UPI002DDCFD67|nr:hypothetical protein [Devosia sp.]HEV2514157.1 hypothetical protein [Devosia sp.]
MIAPQLIAFEDAKASIFRDAPSWENKRTAAIGAVAFGSHAAGVELLARAAAELRGEGFEALIGPMDGDTWHKYRLVSESDGTPPFALEPVSGPYDHAAFTAAGFAPISSYVSSRARLGDTIGEAPVNMAGVSVTAWDGQGAELLIGKLFDMSGSAFAGNRFFKPISREAFLELYRPLLPLLDPRHILFAHGPAGQLVGFLFGMPDRASAVPTAILKTYASGLRGVGHLLADSYHRRALELGFTEVIHALMHEDNVSRQRSERHSARVFRRYALMGRRLAP